MDTDSDDEPMFPFPQEDTFFSAFCYHDPFLTSPLIKAIISGNVEAIRKMIQMGKNLNNPDNSGSTPLHIAVIENKEEILDFLLQQSEITLNCKNHAGDTPLLTSIKMCRPDSFVERFLIAGCNVNIANNNNETPLHIAVTRPSTFIACELLKRGAKINAVDGNGYCPLHHAVESNNLESVCMLLYYCADVNIECRHNLTPFMYAVNDDALDIAKVLFDYYVDFSCVTTDGYTPLLLAANSKSDMAFDIVKAGANINWITPEGNSVVLFSLHYNNAEFFKTVWPKFNHQKLLYCKQPFLLAFINKCGYPTSEWLECMYEILNSPVIFKLLEHCKTQLQRTPIPTFFQFLIEAMYSRKVALNDRLTIIQLYLSFGAEVYIMDINLVYDLYGFNEELEIFVQLGNLHKTFNKLDSFCFPLSTFILAQEDSYSTEYIVKLFKNQFTLYRPLLKVKIIENYTLKAFEFFSLPYHRKQELIQSQILFSEVKNAVSDKLKLVPEMPSLVELSRNQFRKYIKEIYTINTPYRFHEIVDNLNIPTVIRDIIRFKIPLYE